VDSLSFHLVQISPVRSAANAFETGIVLEAKRGEAAGREFDLFVVRAQLEVVPVDAGDCFAYALAKFSGQKLLAKGGNRVAVTGF
jgi:ribonuclease VapC